MSTYCVRIFLSADGEPAEIVERRFACARPSTAVRRAVTFALGRIAQWGDDLDFRVQVFGEDGKPLSSEVL